MTGHPGAEIIGPVHTGDGVARLLGVRVANVAGLRDEYRLLAGRSDTGTWFYPAAQFDGRAVVGGLDEVLQVLGPVAVDAWNICLWFCAPRPDDLDGLSVLGWLRDHHDLEPVLRLAQETAARWSA